MSVVRPREAFLPLFFGDFLGATAEWAGEEASLYLTCLGHQWTLGSLPAEEAKVCRLVRWERRLFDRFWPQVRKKFEEVDGRLVNRRLEEHRTKSKTVAEKNRSSGKAGAEARWRKDGERHADANGATDGERHESGRASPPANPSHPIPSHSSLPSGERGGADAPAAKPPKPPRFDVSTVPGLDVVAWEAFETYRAARKPAIKPESREAAAKALAAYGPDQAAVVQQSIAAGYQGLVPLKSKENARGTSPQGPRKSAVERVRDASGCDLREILGTPPARVGGAG